MKILIYVFLFLPWLIHFLIFKSNDFFMPFPFTSVFFYLITFCLVYSLLVYAFYKVIKIDKIDYNYLFSYIGLFIFLQSSYIIYPVLNNSIFFLILLLGVLYFNIMYYAQTKKHLCREQLLIIPSIILNAFIFLMQLLFFFQIINK